MHRLLEEDATPAGLTQPYLNRINELAGRHGLCSSKAQEATMLFTIAVILLVLWLLGLVSGYTMGNFIYVLLVIALVLFVVGLVSGRRTV
jgi:uncharacterized membrane protein YtjA (UPF0391 family)